MFTNKNASKPILNISIDGHRIDETDHAKFLEVVIDSKLTWKNHISYITGKIAKGIGVITKARKLLDKNTLITLYYAFIFTYLCYCNHVWGNTYITYLDKLYIMEKKVVRIIYGVKPRTHTKPLFEDVKIFISMFVSNSSIHDHDTRQSSHSHSPLIMKELSKSNVRSRGAVVWNAIMKCNVTTIENDYVFCKDLKKKLLAVRCAVKKMFRFIFIICCFMTTIVSSIIVQSLDADLAISLCISVPSIQIQNYYQFSAHLAPFADCIFLCVTDMELISPIWVSRSLCS